MKFGLRGVVGYFLGERDGGTDSWGYTTTDFYQYVFFGGRADLLFGKNTAIGLSVPLYFLDGIISSGASILLGYYDGLNIFTDLGVVYNSKEGAMFSWGFGMGYNKVNVNMEILFSGVNFGLTGGIGIIF